MKGDFFSKEEKLTSYRESIGLVLFRIKYDFVSTHKKSHLSNEPELNFASNKKLHRIATIFIKTCVMQIE